MQEHHPMNDSIGPSIIPSQTPQAFAPIFDPASETDTVSLRIESHPGMFELRRFGEQLRKRPLEFGAVEKGARILYSAVDEFGLHRLRRGVQASHHAFFLETAAAFGVTRSALDDPTLEPMHGSSSRTAVRDYLARRPDCAAGIAAGADAFMGATDAFSPR
jgi:hypothetical protein